MESRGQTDERGVTCSALVRAGPDCNALSTTAVRNKITSIYYMLTSDSPLQVFVCNESDIVHYWHSGGRLEYVVVHETGRVERQVLGPKVQEGDTLQVSVAGHAYKAARLIEGDYVLLGESVAPGFDYSDVSMVSADQLRARLGDTADIDAELLALTT